MPYWGLTWAIHVSVCYTILLLLYYRDRKKKVMFPEAYPQETYEEEKVMLKQPKEKVEKSDNLSGLERFEALPMLGSQGFKLKSKYIERLRMVGTMRRVLTPVATNSEVEGSARENVEHVLSVSGNRSDIDKKVAEEEDAIIMEYMRETNSFIPTISWTGKEGLSQMILTWKMFSSCIFSILTGYELCGTWFVIYASLVTPFSVGVGLFSVERLPRIHVVCTTVTLLGFFMGEILVAGDIWHHESVFVHITMVAWLLLIVTGMLLFLQGLHNSFEWIFILLLESFTFGIAMSRNPLNPSSP